MFDVAALPALLASAIVPVPLPDPAPIRHEDPLQRWHETTEKLEVELFHLIDLTKREPTKARLIDVANKMAGYQMHVASRREGTRVLAERLRRILERMG